MLEQTYEKLWEFVTFRYPDAANVPEPGRTWILDEVGTYIRNYCAITHIPVITPGITGSDGKPRPGGLFYVWAGLAVDVLRYWDAQKEDGEGDPGEISVRDVSEIKLGDTTVRRGGNLDSTYASMVNKQHFPNLDTLVYDYIHSLNQFRKFRW